MRRASLSLALCMAMGGCATSAPPSATTTSATSAPAPACGSTAGCTVPSFDGVPIHYRSLGAGPTAVVLVHCWGCSMKTWDGQVAALAARYQVVLLDLAGHGESGKGRKDYTIQAFGQDVRAVCDALGLKKVILVGHSMGGPVILEAASLM